MFRKTILFCTSLCVMLLGLVACSGTPAVGNEDTSASTDGAGQEAEAVHWGYEGEGGPENWGELEEAYELCATGQQQSPIDLPGAADPTLADVAFDYQETAVNILNNGHTIQVNYDEGSSVEISGRTYQLRQFHFHAPSEHAVDGAIYPAEMHLVHADDDGNLAVVGVFIDEGAENAAFTPIWSHLPTAETEEPIATGISVNAADLLPAGQTIYRYTGSLTTPPCTEGVLWSVMKTPVEMSAGQIAAFTAIFEGNNRPLQPLQDHDLQVNEAP